MGVVQMSKGILEPVSKELLNETQIVCELAKATLGDRTVIDWDRYANSYDAVRDDIGKVIPGFENYNQRVRLPGGFYLPNGPARVSLKQNSLRIKCRLPSHNYLIIKWLMMNT
jgi:hypothetical protein